MTQPLVSIILPVLHPVPEIGGAIESALNQGIDDIEVIVASRSPGTGDRPSWRSLDARVRHVPWDGNGGEAAARNAGLQAARGAHVAFLAADGEWLLGKLAAQLAALKDAGPDIAGCVTGFVVDDAASPRVAVVRSAPLGGGVVPLLARGHSPVATLLFRRHCFDDLGGFDETLPALADWEWLLRYAGRWRLASVPAPLAILRGGRPAPAAADRALDIIAERHADAADAPSARRLRAAVLLARAELAVGDGRRDAACRCAAAALPTFPREAARVLLRAARPRPREPAQRAVARGGRSSVLHVITTLRSGGAENMLAQLVEHDQAAGRRQWVAPLVDGGRHRERLHGAGIAVVDLRINGFAGLFAGLLRLVRLIRQARPDVAVGWMYHANLVLAAAIVLAGRRGRTRLIWGLRSSDMDFGRYHPQLRAVARIGAWLSGMPDAIVANSQAGYSFHLRLGYRPRRFYIVDNGVDVARFAPDSRSRALTRRTLGIPDDACVAVMVARVDPMKDHGTFLAALHVATGITAIAVGRGTESLPDMPGLTRLGERADIPALLAASDIMVLSSAFGEGVPNAVLEGMAAGLAVAATDVGDARRVLGGAGLVVPPRDPGALAAALQRLRDDPVLRQDLGARARKRADALFSIGRAVGSFGRLLDSFGTLAPRWSAVPIAAAETADTSR